MNISVVIPTYNYAAFLPKAVESVLAQTLPPCEIVVADDGSTDDTAAVVARYGDAVRYVRFDHAGVYAVRNAMLAQLKGDWFFNLDADNWIEPDFLEKAATHARTGDERLAFVYPDIVTFGDYVQKRNVPEFSADRFKLGNFVDMNSLIRTDVAKQIGFDSAFNDGWGDYDFFLTLAERGFCGAPLRTSPLHYRVHAASITASTHVFDKKQRLMRRIVAKHAAFFSPEEAQRAIRRFCPEAVMRHRLAEHYLAHRWGALLRHLVWLACRHPSALLLFRPTRSRKTAK